MKTSKLLTLLLIPAVLLTGCGLFGEEPTPEPEPTPTVTGEPQPGSTEVPYSWTLEQLFAYYDTPEFNNTLVKLLGQEIQFNGNNGENIEEGYGQVVVATGTALQFVEKALDNGYFLAHWWGTRDSYKPVGVEQLTTYTMGKAKTEFENNAELLNRTATNNEALTWYNNRIVMPPSNPEYMLMDNCETDWVLVACRAEEPVISNLKATRANISGVITLQMDVHITPIFNQVLDGRPGVEPRTYTYTFTLDPVRVPEIVEESEPVVNPEETTNNIEVTFTPYYLISAIEGKVTVGQPYEW